MNNIKIVMSSEAFAFWFFVWLAVFVAVMLIIVKFAKKDDNFGICLILSGAIIGTLGGAILDFYGKQMNPDAKLWTAILVSFVDTVKQIMTLANSAIGGVYLGLHLTKFREESDKSKTKNSVSNESAKISFKQRLSKAWECLTSFAKKIGKKIIDWIKNFGTKRK